MSTTTTTRPAARAAFEGLIDYAGLFPPAQLAMDAAAREYAGAHAGPHAWMLGRFIVPASRAGELAGVAEAAGAAGPVAVSAIVDASLEPRGWFVSLQGVLAGIAALRSDQPRLHVAALEVPLPPLLTARETFDASIGQLSAMIARMGMRELPTFVELPRGPRWRELLPEAMTALARARFGAKLRCGGTAPDAYPSVEDVAAFVDAAAQEGVPFKATAGLHHPVRHFNAAAGCTMHGFLNLLAAATFAPRLDAAALEAAIAEEDPSAFGFDDTAFSWRGERAEVDELRSVRAIAFTGYGSCSFDEPVDDLTALGAIGRA